ncbi:hypothetical protein [Prevotella sp.]|uniref:hypothetical protein n=1 Tax=Prevotella sp. TaxID=59823 RepID=UPI002F92D02C
MKIKNNEAEKHEFSAFLYMAHNQRFTNNKQIHTILPCHQSGPLARPKQAFDHLKAALSPHGCGLSARQKQPFDRLKTAKRQPKRHEAGMARRHFGPAGA